MRLTRIFLAETLLGVMILTTGATARQKPRAAPPAPARAEQKAPADAETVRRAAIRTTLLVEARENFMADASAFSASGYSQELKIQQDQVTAFLKENDGRIRDRAVFIDPRKFTEGLALGFSGIDMAEKLLDAQQAGRENVKSVASNMSAAYANPDYGIDTVSPSPRALGVVRKGAHPCVLLPTSDFALQGRVPQLTEEEDREYTNRHESWHCMDYGHHLRAFSDHDINAVDEDSLPEFVDKPKMLAIFAIEYNREAFADVGALGDMVRAGHPLSVIDKVAEWRSRKTEGLNHRSRPLIDALKAAIEQIGLEKFRAMTDVQAHGLYYAVMEKHEMTAKNLQIALRYDDADDKRAAAFDRKALKDPEVRNGIAFSKLLGNTGLPPVPEKSPDAASAEALKNWDAAKALETEAVRLRGEITPATLVAAYESMQDGFRRQMKQSPEDPATALYMTKLQQVFIADVQTIDYVAANAAAGVDIIKAKPGLEKIAPVATASAPNAMKKLRIPG